jgi:hypothetical protein
MTITFESLADPFAVRIVPTADPTERGSNPTHAFNLMRS